MEETVGYITPEIDTLGARRQTPLQGELAVSASLEIAQPANSELFPDMPSRNWSISAVDYSGSQVYAWSTRVRESRGCAGSVCEEPINSGSEHVMTRRIDARKPDSFLRYHRDCFPAVLDLWDRVNKVKAAATSQNILDKKRRQLIHEARRQDAALKKASLH